MGRHRLSSGLTLLEMLVVLMIAGMALALGFQSLGQWRRAETAIASLGASTREMSLTRDWLESSLHALTPVSEQAFKGSATELSGITLQPLLATQGGATPIVWRIEADAGRRTLVLQEYDDTLEMPLRDVETAEFVYIDAEGAQHRQWPPALGMQDALPVSIGLHLGQHDGSQRLWAAGILGARNPGHEVFQIEQD